MTTKNKIYLSVSLFTLLYTLYAILTSSEPRGVLNDALSFQWILIGVLALLMPIFNVAEIIINKDDWNRYYWIGILFNIATIAFIVRYFGIEF